MMQTLLRYVFSSLFRGFSELETGRLLEAFESRFQAINQIHFEWI